MRQRIVARLVLYRPGRIVLHVVCMMLAGRLAFHLAGIIREMHA